MSEKIDKEKMVKILRKDWEKDVKAKIAITRQYTDFNDVPFIQIKVINGKDGTTIENVSLNNPVEAIITVARIVNKKLAYELMYDMKFLCSFGVRANLPTEKFVQPMTNMGGIDMETGFPICAECRWDCSSHIEENKSDLGG